MRKIWKFCTKFGHLILSKIVKFAATRRQILSLKCTKIDFVWGSAYSAPPSPLTRFKGPTSKGREGKRKIKKRREEKEESSGVTIRGGDGPPRVTPSGGQHQTKIKFLAAFKKNTG